MSFSDENGALLVCGDGGGLVLRFNGESWKSFGASTTQDLYTVSGSGLEKLYLAGLTGLTGTIIRFQDQQWQREFSGVRSDLHCLGQSAGSWYAAGSHGTILRNDDGIWENEESSTTATLQAIAAADCGLYAVGSGGVIVHRSI